MVGRRKGVVIDYRNIPTIKKAKKRLGPLWFLLYDVCSCDPCMCMEKIRSAFYGHVWHSPSDTLEKNVIMKAPFTRKYIQATAHKVISDIGTKLEHEILEQYEIEKQEELILQEQILAKQFQDSIIEQIKDAEAVERTACHRELQRLQEQLEFKLVNDIVDLEQKMEQEFQDYSKEHNDKLGKKWERKLEKAVEKTTKKVTKTLLHELARQEEVLEKHFKIEIKKKELVKQYEIEKQSAELEKTLQIEKQRNECQNIGNMVYLLCIERQKCLKEKKLIEKHYSKIQSELILKVSIQKKKMEALQKELEGQIQQLNLREVCYLEIIKQYQKFINFALRSAPTQAQFLLSIQTLMSFELSEILPKEKTPVQMRLPLLCETILPWSQNEPNASPKMISGLELTDYHDCFNELAMPKNEGETELPAFYYKNKLYVREDFRNLISQGINLTPSHDLWSDDLEILLKTLKQFASEPEIFKGLSDMEGIDQIRGKKDGAEGKEIGVQRSQFKKKKSDLRKSSMKEKPTLKQNVETVPIIVADQFGSTDTSEYMLLASNCSVELLKQKGTVKVKTKLPVIEEREREKEEKVPEQDEQEVRVEIPNLEMQKLKASDTEIRTSLPLQSDSKLDISTKLQKTSFSMSVKSSEMHKAPELKKKTSKIAAARDSVAILRESRQALLSPTISSGSPKKEEEKKNHHQIMPFRDICCDKCLRQRGLELEEVKYSKTTSSDVAHKRKTSDSHAPEKVIGTVQPSGRELDIYKEEFYPDKLEKLYHFSKPKDIQITSETKIKEHLTPSAKIQEDIVSKDHDDAYDNDYTIQRMRSFISVISDNPKLIKLFTACQQ